MENLTLSSMCGGGVQEHINRALSKISDNILDPNTEAGKKRTLTVKIEFIPNKDDREDVAVDVQTSYKLVPESSLSTQLYIQKDLTDGSTNITEHLKGQIKGQLTLDELGIQKSEEPVTAEELGCDEETGEILNTDEAAPKVIDLRAVR